MTLLELFIVYLTVGAPFGAHYYLTRADFKSVAPLWLRAIAAGSGWTIYAAFLLRERISSASRKQQNRRAADCEKIDSIAQDLTTAANELLANNSELSFFEFRETLERYIGLTETVNDLKFESADAPRETEIFRVAKRSKKEQRLGAQLVARRNARRLLAHHASARIDFARVVEKLHQFSFKTEPETLRRCERDAAHLAHLLGDAEAIELLKKSSSTRQTAARANVEKATQSEQIIWKTELKKLQFPALRAQAASAPLKTTKD